MADASGLDAYGFERKPILQKEICALAEHVEDRLAEHEHVRVLARAFSKDTWKKQFVLLVLTEQRLLAFDGKTGNQVDEAPNDGVRYTYRPEKHVNALEVATSGKSRLFRGVSPQREAIRIMRLATGKFGTEDNRALLAERFPAEPEGPLSSVVYDSKLFPRQGSIYLYQDRLVAGEVGDHLPFGGGPVRATVDTAGNIAATRGRNLAAKGAATALAGAAGALLVGNARVQTIDTRMLWLVVEAPRWTFTRPYAPDRQAAVARFAQSVNSVASQYLARENTVPRALETPPIKGNADAALAEQFSREEADEAALTAGGTLPVTLPEVGAEDKMPSTREDASTRLRTLAGLRDDGIITDEEFEREKQRILRQI